MTAPRLRMAAIHFLNPAPLMWNFEHPPEAARLSERYHVERMMPAACAGALAENRADLGLLPIGAYAAMAGLAVVPGCAVASLGAIRSLLLVFRTGGEPGQGEEPDLDPPSGAELARIGTVALDASSRSSALYTQILFRRFWGHMPRFVEHPPALDAMLAVADAALLIGDPALHALRDRDGRRQRTGERLGYLDLGHAWRAATGTAWVSAFWAVRAEALGRFSGRAIADDLQHSRDAGLLHLPELVAEWAPRLELRPEIVRDYLGRNIHYKLDAEVLAGAERFFTEAYALGLIAGVPRWSWAA